MSFKHLVFDLGNVICDIDPPRTQSQLSALAGGKFDNAIAIWEGEDLFNRYELGLLDEQEFYRWLRMGLPSEREYPDSVLTDAWNALLIQIPADRLQLLRGLRRAGYKIYLLSNTNATHLDWVYRHIEYKFEVSDFDAEFFDQAFYSHRLGLRKPSVDIYHKVTELAALDAATTLFIDDLPENVASAQQAGWHGVVHPVSGSLEETLKSQGIEW
jgi:glucose-1-phosphatase